MPAPACSICQNTHPPNVHCRFADLALTTFDRLALVERLRASVQHEEMVGTALYAFNQHEIATIRTALRYMHKSHKDTCELTAAEIDTLCDRLNPMDAVVLP
jgi:galactokinase